ncbi:N-acetylglucosamine-6-phosphate deacetylase [Paenibacillus sp. FSL A5-0031]|uniref:N-acetylglucosamine-6-phosphate deacetylase n=1 Tax=Paenibacillus sp. FSL A5-0031 TaxID=1920420 RepID=UPI00096C894C|nr:N-acetylglucosamine-6-phosphate deacetylase [Paenibacillus sp. FSL A5-0031]OME83879.1 N-acetylglucosamine-6-phosphate deacetylase [Paenibacillus sp. FSL A5-0031]
MTLNSANWFIHNVNIVLEDGIVNGSVFVQDGKIAKIVAQDDNEAANEASDAQLSIDGKGGWLLPGFIDVHVHGGFGADFMDASRESFDTITKFHASQGTTGMLATTMTAPKEAIEDVLHAVADYRSSEMPYAALYGVHLEGPFISEVWPGAQNPAYIKTPQLEWMQQWHAKWPDLLRQLTLAPEKSGAIETIAWLAEQGIVTACGHTDAVYAEVIAAADAGLTQAVHTYNAMRGLHHREPGTLGAVLTDDRIVAELIADGIHVHPAAIRLVLAAKPSDKVILITDAMAAAGMPEGEYSLGGLAVIVKNGEARLKDGNALAGSCLTMIGAVRFIHEHTNLSLSEISRLASGNAAKQLGISDRTGTITSGKQADLVWIDSQMQVQQTWAQGRSIYEAKQA